MLVHWAGLLKNDKISVELGILGRGINAKTENNFVLQQVAKDTVYDKGHKNERKEIKSGGMLRSRILEPPSCKPVYTTRYLHYTLSHTRPNSYTSGSQPFLSHSIQTLPSHVTHYTYKDTMKLMCFNCNTYTRNNLHTFSNYLAKI